MNNNDIKRRTINPIDDSNSSTLTSTFNNYDENIKQNDKDSARLIELLTTTNKMSNRLDDLEKENKLLHEELNDTRTRENKLLNRFSWLLLIINIGSVVLIIMAIILFIDSFYPFIKKLIDNSLGATIVVGAIGTAISGGIIGLWWTFNKYVNKVIEREKKQ